MKKLKTSLLVPAGLLAFLLGASGVAGAAEIATPLQAKTPFSLKAGSPPLKRKLWGSTYLGNPLRLLVLKDQMVGGIRHLKLRLPERPNNSFAWVREDHVNLTESPARIEIDLSERRVTLFWGGDKKWSEPVVIGAPRTPTPTGQFAIYERDRTNTDLRPWVFELTAHSETLRSYNGGPGRVAMHGRHGALAAAMWGTAGSHGCIRMPDKALHRIAKQAPPGSPVRIRR
jgi:hypothetical protein